MSCQTIERIKVNPAKFKQVRGDMSREEFARKTGVSEQMQILIEKGARWQKTLDKFADFCLRTNQEPNAFFEIVKKIS